MSIYYKDYEQELWLTANSSGYTGVIGIPDERYASVLIYWQISRPECENITIHDEINIPVTDCDLKEFHQKQIEKIKRVMTCPLEDLPLYINDEITKYIAIKRLREE